MSCNCKSVNNLETSENVRFLKTNNKEKIKLIGHYILKMVGFIIGILLLPLINVAIVIFMFNTIVLTKEVNMVKIIKRFTNHKFNNNYDEDDEDDFDNLTEDDVVMLDVEDITKKY
jgi:hypothetical protein